VCRVVLSSYFRVRHYGERSIYLDASIPHGIRRGRPHRALSTIDVDILVDRHVLLDSSNWCSCLWLGDR
jgi:hypothetical protein